MTMAYRDPRDIILSMIDHGKRSREGRDGTKAFSGCVDVAGSIKGVQRMMINLTKWESKSWVHTIRYEDLLNKQLETIGQMINFLGWNVDEAEVVSIAQARSSKKKESWNFNKGTTERWRDEMFYVEKDTCRESFDPFVRKFGYPLW